MNFVISNKFDFFFIKFPIILPIVYLFFLSAFPLYEDYLILLTFDDGYSSLVDIALPIFKVLNFTGTVFLNTGWINNTRSLSDL